MIFFAVYDTSTGEIRQVGRTGGTDLNNHTPANPALSVIELSENSPNYYIDIIADPHVAIAKTALPYTINKTTIIADEVDTCSITGLPNPSTVKWPDDEITIETDGEASFTLDLAGEYTIEISSLHYIKEVINVTASDPA